MTRAGLTALMLVCGLTAAGCQAMSAGRTDVLVPAAPPLPPIPRQVQRLAVLYPQQPDREVAYGYARLEQAVLRLKQRRPWIRVLERRHLAGVTNEQRLQVSGRVADDSAIHVGRLLGADSILVFHIDGPSWRDRLLARMHGTMPPVVVSSKLVQVESGEVLYHDLIIRTPVPGPRGWEDYGSDREIQPLLQTSLEQSLSDAIANLDEAFR